MRPQFTPRLASLCLLFAGLTATPLARAAELAQTTVVEALQRGLLKRLPAQFSLQSASFTEVSRIDHSVTIKGEAVFVTNEDTFVAVRRLGLKHPSGELNATIIRRVHAAGATFTAPFDGVVSLLNPAPQLTPKLDIATQGQPRPAFKATVIEGTKTHQQLLALDQTFAATDERYQRVKEKWSRLQELGELLASYDAWAAVHPSSMEGRVVKALDSKELGKAYDTKVYRAKKLTDGRAKHAAFVQLVKPAFAPEYARIKAIADPRESAAKAYVEFLEQL